MAAPKPKETDLYSPIKAMLEKQGYDVKGEVGPVDIVAVRDAENPVIVELKTGFSLSLFHQAIDRQSMTDTVYVAVPRGSGRVFQKMLNNNKSLCRRLGLGLITVRLKDCFVEVHLDPMPYKPRGSKHRKVRLLREFEKRVGDPNEGGATRKGLITAYRQDALRCLAFLSANGPTKAALVAAEAQVDRARRIMADDHYGWFERVATGIYDVTPKGINAVSDYASELSSIASALKDKGS